MLRPLVLSAMLGIASLGGLAATPSQAQAHPWHAHVYVAPYGGAYYWSGGVYSPGVSVYYNAVPSYYVAPDYAYSPGYATLYAAPVYGYRSYYYYPGYYHHHHRH
jgi:hypothetical protein